MDIIGRKKMALISTTLLTIFLFLYAGLNSLYGESTNTSGIYGSVAVIFLFQGSYSFGWTPLSVLYPPEVLHYSMRGSGMSVYCFVVNAVGLMVTMGQWKSTQTDRLARCADSYSLPIRHGRNLLQDLLYQCRVGCARNHLCLLLVSFTSHSLAIQC